jgi:hypothetical protein
MEVNIFLYFPWFPVKAALSIVTLSLTLKTIFDKELVKTIETAVNAES